MALQIHLQPTPSPHSPHHRRPRTAPTLSTIADGVPLSTPPRAAPLSLPRVPSATTTPTAANKPPKGVISQLVVKLRRKRTKSTPNRADVEMALAPPPLPTSAAETAAAAAVTEERSGRTGRSARHSSVRTVPVYSEEINADEILLSKTLQTRLPSPPASPRSSPPRNNRTSISSISSLSRVRERDDERDDPLTVGESEREGLLQGEGREVERVSERPRPVIRVQPGTLDATTSPDPDAASPLSPPPIYRSPIESFAPAPLLDTANANAPRQRRSPPSSFLSRVGNRLRPSSSGGLPSSSSASSSPASDPTNLPSTAPAPAARPRNASFGSATSAPNPLPASAPSPGNSFRALLPGRRSRTNSQTSSLKLGEIGSPVPESLLRGSYGFANAKDQPINSRRTSLPSSRPSTATAEGRRASNASEETLAEPEIVGGGGARITEDQVRYLTEQGRLNMLAVGQMSLTLPPPPTFDQATIASMHEPRDRARRSRRPHTAGGEQSLSQSHTQTLSPPAPMPAARRTRSDRPGTAGAGGGAPSIAPSTRTSKSGRPRTAGSIMGFGGSSSRPRSLAGSRAGSRPGSRGGRTQTSMAEGLSPTEADAARTQYILFSPF